MKVSHRVDDVVEWVGFPTFYKIHRWHVYIGKACGRSLRAPRGASALPRPRRRRRPAARKRA